jgi:hypothetical protein
LFEYRFTGVVCQTPVFFVFLGGEENGIYVETPHGWESPQMV